MARRTALLTGGTGFLGRHVARALVEEGFAVRLLARRPVALEELGLESLPVETVAGDLSREDGLEEAAAGCDAIVHAAGILNAHGLQSYRDVNVRGTERLVHAAAQAAPQAMWVLVSSQAAVGPSRNGRPVREEDEPRPVSWYGQSKLEGEEVVRRLWTGPWIVLRPCAVYGPGDRGLLVYFRMAASGWLPVPAAGSRIHVAHARSVALAVARAASRTDLSGRTGFLCDPVPLTLGELAAAVGSLTRPPARLLKLPRVLVRAAAAAETLKGVLTGRVRPFNADKAREVLAGDWLCDGGPMRRDLDLPPPVPLLEGLFETREWYQREGWLTL